MIPKNKHILLFFSSHWIKLRKECMLRHLYCFPLPFSPQGTNWIIAIANYFRTALFNFRIFFPLRWTQEDESILADTLCTDTFCHGLHDLKIIISKKIVNFVRISIRYVSPVTHFLWNLFSELLQPSPTGMQNIQAYLPKQINTHLVKCLCYLSIRSCTDGFLQTIQCSCCTGSGVIYICSIHHFPYK